jgi:hypothetical protein
MQTIAHPTPAVKQVNSPELPSPCRDPRGDHKNGLVPRPLTHQTYEQKYCGLWYDCPFCLSSVLIMSDALKRDLDAQRQETGSLFGGEVRG